MTDDKYFSDPPDSALICHLSSVIRTSFRRVRWGSSLQRFGALQAGKRPGNKQVTRPPALKAPRHGPPQTLTASTAS